jgi:hypothetical protein
MDQDLEMLSREALITEIKKLRSAIRQHRDASGHDLCWYHPKLWALLPEKTDPALVIPNWPQFMQGCVEYRKSLDEQLPNALRNNQGYQE